MSGVSVSCPECSASLKLPDRKLLGRKGKCPKCQHRFILALPQPDGGMPESPRSDAPEPARPQTTPLPGKAARWIPDQPPVAPQDLPVFQLADESASPPLNPASNTPVMSPTAIEVASPPAFDFVAAVPDGGSPGRGTGSVTDKLIRRRRKRYWPAVLTGVTTAVVGGVIIAVVLLNRESDKSTVVQAPPVANPEWEQQKASMATSNQDASALSPTSGEVIPLNYIPFTPHLILHLRPAELWQRDRQLAEFQATLGDLSLWLKSSMQTMTRFEPEEIEELTFAVNFGPRTSVPEVAAVVRLREQQSQADLFRRFAGRLRPDLDVDVYESGDLCFLLVDLKTFAVAPTSLVDELAAAKDYPALPPADLDPLLRESDRQRHLTLMFDINQIDVHREFVFGDHLGRSELLPLSDQFVVWFGKEIETISWSLHLQPNLFMETLLRQSNDSSALKAQRHMRLQLERLPQQMLTLAELMRPSTEGSRQMVGRFPAMMQAVSLATSVDVAGQYVRCTTVLPQKAAANLAAASLLTWNQSVVTDFSTAVAVQPTTTLPETIVGRLELPVLVDFRETPLQEVMAYLSDEIKTEIVINGDGLKSAAFTQNMPQTHNLGTVSAKAAFHAILQQYAEERDPMVICIDEAAKRITLTTRSEAALEGMTEFNTAP